jgi:CRISPR-associated protein (TIGR03985 family)
MFNGEFIYPLTPEILQWLAGGQLGNRFLRAVRLWILLNRLYSGESPLVDELGKSWSYAELRDRLFATTHPKSDRINVEKLTQHCTDGNCICHRTVQQFLEKYLSEQPSILSNWQQEVIHLSGLPVAEVKKLFKAKPFSTVHRSLRDDLKQLVRLGWLQNISQGKYQCVSKSDRPHPPQLSYLQGSPATIGLEAEPASQLLTILEDISFVQPNLEVIIQSLWEQLLPDRNHKFNNQPPLKRIFIHLDYILPPEIQEQVDNYQEQIEQLWRTAYSGVIQFDYEFKPGQIVTINTYPVCLHYVRRAKYLSAWGETPEGEIGWHNYRLDRIVSEKLKILVVGDPQVPKHLREMRRVGELPTPDDVQQELEIAWGFNFYLPRKWLLMRFPRKFADRYVEGTLRHPTFQRINYQDLANLVKQQVPEEGDRQRVLKILQNRNPEDAYYCAWVRVGDINVLMRLRDWRPNGEVILPFTLREQMANEARQELSFYNLPAI